MSDLSMLQLQIVDHFNPDTPSALDYLLIFITFFGDWKVLGGLSVLAFLKDRSIGGKLIPLFIVTGALLLPFKTLLWEERPFLVSDDIRVIGEPASSSSFPSGHATYAFAYAFLLGRVYGNARYFYALALLIAFSRIYLGQHYPGDVVIGAGLGIVSGYATNYLYSKKKVLPWKP